MAVLFLAASLRSCDAPGLVLLAFRLALILRILASTVWGWETWVRLLWVLPKSSLNMAISSLTQDWSVVSNLSQQEIEFSTGKKHMAVRFLLIEYVPADRRTWVFAHIILEVATYVPYPNWNRGRSAIWRALLGHKALMGTVSVGVQC